MKTNLKNLYALKSCLILVRSLACFWVLIIPISLTSCDDFTLIDQPITELNAPAVFEEMNTANAAIADVYAKIRDYGMLTGKTEGISKEMGLYADELDWYGNSSQNSAQFYTNTLLPTHTTVANWWNNAYSQIYAANAVIEGVEASTKLSDSQKERLIGEAKFARAFIYSYLVQLYGSVPYVTGTDYKVNQSVTRLTIDAVYDLIITDLEEASQVLSADYSSPPRSLPNSFVAKALMARVYLNAGKWAEAANSASAILNATDVYSLEADLNSVFLIESVETIWNYAGRSATRNTDDGTTFIFNSAPPNSVALTDSLLDTFETGDQRKEQWVRGVSDDEEINTYFHANKYKKRGASGPQVEFTVVLRLAELYLIRAEARARQGELINAKGDLNIIRNRAGLNNTSAVSGTDVLNAILQERRVELFTEFGHRFMDLKRFGALDVALAGKPDWDVTEENLPIPQTELNLNPNFGSQNPGY